ncbi:hypothetical protein E2C01_085012 [Portunus trituberculatus]|uniref:Uncharacterized protein n=1 Tax=Portunus trituberculatus TaxID=210409 RepID=A0A5B7J5I6_PORTR|nr:hypothetical protein [Portunus trituberculatus]
MHKESRAPPSPDVPQPVYRIRDVPRCLLKGHNFISGTCMSSALVPAPSASPSHVPYSLSITFPPAP